MHKKVAAKKRGDKIVRTNFTANKNQENQAEISPEMEECEEDEFE